MPSMQQAAPWVKWIPIPADPQGQFFYDVPMARLKNFKCDEIICLYQHLTGHEFASERYFQATKFDQYKYIRAEIPFIQKWQLNKYITRDPAREQALRNQVVTCPDYVVVHLQGSDHRATYDPGIIPEGWQVIEITEQPDTLVLDWLGVIEGAQSIIMVDSVYANLVDQLGLGDDRYFIQRSHVGLTPVLGQHWTWL